MLKTLSFFPFAPFTPINNRPSLFAPFSVAVEDTVKDAVEDNVEDSVEDPVAVAVEDTIAVELRFAFISPSQ